MIGIFRIRVQPQRTEPGSNGAAFDSLLANDRDKATIFGNAFNPTIVNNGTIIPSAGRALSAANGSIVIPVSQVLIPPGLDLSRLV